LDSDSSKFDKSEFPQNYIKHIKDNLGKADVILVSSHKEVREALVDNQIQFTLVYPEVSNKDEYIQRYIDRGSPEAFVNLLTKNWDMWISELEDQNDCSKIKLQDGQYLSDVL
jgi:wyosine [tRNA(Phe)-imidazoG37] synthetase (radical SAM superfamily)